MRCATPEETALALARVLVPLDLVPMLDHAVAFGDLDLRALESMTETRRPGSRALRFALGWMNPASESWWESMLRMLHESCGVEVQCQAVLRDATGLFVGRGDLRIVGTATVPEYDGAYHRDVTQQAADLRRDRALTSAGFRRRGYVADDLLHRPLQILRDIDHDLGRRHDPRRIEQWLRWVASSLHTARGHREFRARVGVTRPRRRTS